MYFRASAQKMLLHVYALHCVLIYHSPYLRYAVIAGHKESPQKVVSAITARLKDWDLNATYTHTHG